MENIRLSHIDLPDLYYRWAQGAGCFSCFVRKTNFVSLKHYRDFDLKPVSKSKSRLFKYFLSNLELPDTDNLLLFDVPAVDGIRLGYLLQEHLRLKPILTYVSPLHPYGLIGGDRYVNTLVGYGLALRPINPQGFVFILDNQRYFSKVSQRLLQRRFNNQYELTADDLPGLSMLRTMGYRQATLYRMGDVKEDVAAYLQYLKENGIQVIEFDIQINKGNSHENAK